MLGPTMLRVVDEQCSVRSHGPLELGIERRHGETRLIISDYIEIEMLKDVMNISIVS